MSCISNYQSVANKAHLFITTALLHAYGMLSTMSPPGQGVLRCSDGEARFTQQTLYGPAVCSLLLLPFQGVRAAGPAVLHQKVCVLCVCVCVCVCVCCACVCVCVCVLCMCVVHMCCACVLCVCVVHVFCVCVYLSMACICVCMFVCA